MPILGKCSRCSALHYQHFDSRYKLRLQTYHVGLSGTEHKMVCVNESDFTDRADEKYLEFLEELRNKIKEKQCDRDALAEILKRLDKLETTGKTDGGASQVGSTQGKAIPSAADLVTLSESINHLSLAVGADADKQGTHAMRPEYYVQKVTKGWPVRNM